MDMQKMLKQAKKMQEELAEVQDSLKDVTVDATAGGGMVKATMDGSGELKSITIDPEAVDPDDLELLQDMIVAAVNEASRNAQELANQRMSSVTNGLNIPGLSGLGF
jgi:DNA-binding YbaB/EbfC family protein